MDVKDFFNKAARTVAHAVVAGATFYADSWKDGGAKPAGPAVSMSLREIPQAHKLWEEARKIPMTAKSEDKQELKVTYTRFAFGLYKGNFQEKFGREPTREEIEQAFGADRSGQKLHDTLRQGCLLDMKRIFKRLTTGDYDAPVAGELETASSPANLMKDLTAALEADLLMGGSRDSAKAFSILKEAGINPEDFMRMHKDLLGAEHPYLAVASPAAPLPVTSGISLPQP